MTTKKFNRSDKPLNFTELIILTTEYNDTNKQQETIEGQKNVKFKYGDSLFEWIKWLTNNLSNEKTAISK